MVSSQNSFWFSDMATIGKFPLVLLIWSKLKRIGCPSIWVLGFIISPMNSWIKLTLLVSTKKSLMNGSDKILFQQNLAWASPRIRPTNLCLLLRNRCSRKNPTKLLTLRLDKCMKEKEREIRKEAGVGVLVIAKVKREVQRKKLKLWTFVAISL